MKKEDIKIAFFSSYDKVGGAAIACYNCVKMLRDQGYEAIEIVRYKTCDDEFIYQVPVLRRRSLLQRLVEKIYPPKTYRDIKEDTDPEYRFFGDESESPKMCTIDEIEKAVPFIPDVIFVGHSYDLINTYRLSLLSKKWKSKVYMICTDINAYTGGCHVHWNCKGYTSGCENCPAVLVDNRKHEVAEAFERKRKNIIAGNIGIRYTNYWQKREIEESVLFKDQPHFFAGPNVDTDLYNSNNRDIAKKVFGVPIDSQVIINGSTYLYDRRKGLSYFCESMNKLWQIIPTEKRKKIWLFIIGKDKKTVQPLIDSLPPFNIKFLDFITDTRLLSLAYQASDIYVGTSLEDAGPMMVSDCLACGTPVVGFKTGVIADERILVDGKSGFAVELGNTDVLADKIKEILTLTHDEFQYVSNYCRNIAVSLLSKQYTLKKYDEFFSKLYK